MPTEDDTELAARLLADCRALQRRRRLDSTTLSEWERVLTSSSPSSTGLGDVQRQVRALLESELGDVVERVRVARNEQQRQSMGNADLAAIAAGGALGALNAWMRPAKPTSSSSASSSSSSMATATSLWASAYDAAAASLNVVRQRRQVEHMKISLLSGDPAASTHVLLCINGFMTQSDDPIKNWQAWCREGQGIIDESSGRSTAVYAVEWEAGDAKVWSEFCAHVNDNLAGAPVSAVVAHFTGNPWHKAQGKADQVGILLAQLIAHNPVLFQNRQLTLLGHSLGGAVIFSVFQELARLNAQRPPDDPSPPLVTNAVSFAGAFIPDAKGLANITHGLARGGKFLNVFSTRDNVLSKLFWAIHLPGHNDPMAAGCQAIATDDEQDKVVNVDVSDLIPPSVDNHFGHSYGRHMDMIAQRVLPHLHARRPATA